MPVSRQLGEVPLEFTVVDRDVTEFLAVRHPKKLQLCQVLWRHPLIGFFLQTGVDRCEEGQCLDGARPDIYIDPPGHFFHDLGQDNLPCRSDLALSPWMPVSYLTGAGLVLVELHVCQGRVMMV